jgi:hypothetical protein
MSEMQGSRRKSRIVIDVAQAQAEARSQRRGRFSRSGKVLSIVAVIALGLGVLLIAGGFFWWRSFTRGPAYSVAMLIDAARRGDMATVETLIDGDQIAQGFVPQVIDKLAGGGIALPSSLQRGQLAGAMPMLIPRVRETIRDEIARGMKGVAEATGQNLPVPLLALAVSRAAQIVEAGDNATIKLTVPDRSLELAMRRDGEQWKVVTVKDDVLASDIAARLASSISVPAESQPQTRRRPR